MCLSLALLMLLTAPPPCIFNRAHMPTPATHRKAPVCTHFALQGTLLGPFWSPMKGPCSFATPLSAKRAQRGMGLSLMRFPGGFGVCVVSRTVSYGVLRCRTVSYGVLRCRTVFGPSVGPCVVRCSYGVDSVRDVRCTPLWSVTVRLRLGYGFGSVARMGSVP